MEALALEAFDAPPTVIDVPVPEAGPGEVLVRVSNTGGNPGHLLALAELVVRGKLHVAIRRKYALADAAQALQDFSNEHTLGKLVITMT